MEEICRHPKNSWEGTAKPAASILEEVEQSLDFRVESLNHELRWKFLVLDPKIPHSWNKTAFNGPSFTLI